MGLSMLIALVVVAIVAIVALDALGLGWLIRKVWRGNRGRRK